MKYVILIYSNPATWRALPPAEAERIIGVHNDLIAELTESGEFVGIYRLADGATAKTIDGVGPSPVVTDGPFAEAKEYLAGFCRSTARHRARRRDRRAARRAAPSRFDR